MQGSLTTKETLCCAELSSCLRMRGSSLKIQVMVRGWVTMLSVLHIGPVQLEENDINSNTSELPYSNTSRVTCRWCHPPFINDCSREELLCCGGRPGDGLGDSVRQGALPLGLHCQGVVQADGPCACLRCDGRAAATEAGHVQPRCSRSRHSG